VLDNRQNTIEQAQSKNPGYETDKAQTAKKSTANPQKVRNDIFLFVDTTQQGLCHGRASVRLSVRLSQHSAAARRCGRFAAVGPAGRRYRSIAARPGVSSTRAAARRTADNAGSGTSSADVGRFVFLVSDAVVDTYVAIVLLSTGGAARLSFPLYSEPPPRTTVGFPLAKSLSTDGSLSMLTDSHNNTNSTSTMTGLFYQQLAPVDYTTASDQLVTPTPTLEPATTAHIVGPMIYLYFSTDNSSDAGFTVDLLFQHRSYAEVSRRLLLLTSASY